MRTSLLRVFVAILCCRAAAGLAAEAAPHLDIFLLSEVPLPDYRLIDTPAYPQTRVCCREARFGHQLSKGSVDQRGSEGTPGQDRADNSSLELRLTLTDAEALEIFSAANVGKRIVFMLGARPLFAPILHTPLSTQTVQINPPEGADMQEIKRELEALIAKPK